MSACRLRRERASRLHGGREEGGAVELHPETLICPNHDLESSTHPNPHAIHSSCFYSAIGLLVSGASFPPPPCKKLVVIVMLGETAVKQQTR